jgi:hypothetical protein
MPAAAHMPCSQHCGSSAARADVADTHYQLLTHLKLLYHMFLQEMLAHKKAVQRMGKKSKVGSAAAM